MKVLQDDLHTYVSARIAHKYLSNRKMFRTEFVEKK
jgi:hypothetical protein